MRLGLLTRNVTIESAETLRHLFRRHDIDLDAFDHLACLSLREDKTPHFHQPRERLGIHPTRCYACGDEYSDYLAALGAGIYPFIVAYGAEDRQRLTGAYGVPDAFIHASPAEFADSLRHALDLDADGGQDATPAVATIDTTPAAGSAP